MGIGQFEIELDLGAGISPSQAQAFYRAAGRWSRCIVAPLSAVLVDGLEVTGVRIRVRVDQIDGVGRVRARGWPDFLRPASAPLGAYLPATGSVLFDADDLINLENRGLLENVICHEMGHVLGIGSKVWEHRGLVDRLGTEDPVFTGALAMHEFGALQGLPAMPVPVENKGGLGIANLHWRETRFGSELMSSYLPEAHSALSRVTLAALQDLGYEVDYAAADPFFLSVAKTFGDNAVTGESHWICDAPNIRPRILGEDALVRW